MIPQVAKRGHRDSQVPDTALRICVRLVRLGAVLMVVLFASGEPVAASVKGDDPPGSTSDPVELILFWGNGCPHCDAEREFLDELSTSLPYLVVREYEVFNDEENRELFRDMAVAAGIEARSVPTTFLGERVWVGFGETTAAEIEQAIRAAHDGHGTTSEGAPVVDVPLIGPVDVGDRSLLVSTVLIGFVDGVNPCSLWVLSILLTLVLRGGSRRRLVLVGSAFLAVTSAMYGLYVAGFYTALQYVDLVPWIQRGVAVLVGVLGLMQLKDVVAFHRGPSLGVPEKAKPGIYQRMRRLADPDRPLPVVLAATAVLAVGVSLLETPCTLGLPLLWTDLLARSGVSGPGAVLLFFVYMLAFLVDELAVFALVILTMRAVKLQERHGRELKLVSGVVMVSLSVVMFARPTLLETVGGALVVFGTAAVLASVGLIGERFLRRV